MNENFYNKTRMLVAFFVAMLVAIAVNLDNNFLALGAVLTGMLFVVLVRRKVGKKFTDERVEEIGKHAASWTYAIITPTIGITAVLLIFLGKGTPFLESLATLLSYITLFMLTIYSITYYFFKNKLS